MQKRDLLIYRGTTGLFSAFILMGAGMYLFNNAMVVEMFAALGYPAHIIYPLAAAKILGVVALWHKQAGILREWAYAGFVYVLTLGTMAHLSAGDEQFMGALVALVLVLVSYAYSKKV